MAEGTRQADLEQEARQRGLALVERHEEREQALVLGRVLAQRVDAVHRLAAVPQLQRRLHQELRPGALQGVPLEMLIEKLKLIGKRTEMSVFNGPNGNPRVTRAQSPY